LRTFIFINNKIRSRKNLNVSTSMVEPYNAILSSHSMIENSEITLLYDNEALYEICSKNLVPFRRIHFMISTYAPILCMTKALNTKSSIWELTSKSFETSSIMANCKLMRTKFMACCLLYRGNINPKEINFALTSVKSNENIHFVNWCPTGFKCGINYQTPKMILSSKIYYSSRSVCMLVNTTAIKLVFKRISFKFGFIYNDLNIFKKKKKILCTRNALLYIGLWVKAWKKVNLLRLVRIWQR